jgi:hypothetical protein
MPISLEGKLRAQWAKIIKTAALSLCVLVAISAGGHASDGVRHACFERVEKSLNQLIASKQVPQDTAQAFQRWSAIPRARPEKVPYFGLGLSVYLDKFCETMFRKLDHPVISWQSSFYRKANGYVDPDGEKIRKFNLLRTRHSSRYQDMMESYAKEYSGQKNMLFDLTGVDMDKFRAYAKDKIPNQWTATNEEIERALEDRIVFDHIRWFKDGIELD